MGTCGSGKHSMYYNKGSHLTLFSPNKLLNSLALLFCLLFLLRQGLRTIVDGRFSDLQSCVQLKFIFS